MPDDNTLTAREFDHLSQDVWNSLLPLIPEELKAHFQKIHILIEDVATEELLAELGQDDVSEDPLSLCGLYVGVPLTESSVTFPSLLPDRVYLFRQALLDLADYDGGASSRRRLREEIAVTLLHEIGHFFGLSEEDLERLGYD
ncbi:MAG: metallopeptidase family protein [Bdellovibrionaceae bacterium]|nr:metallopeptidase family protein [Pseudobdellovibrionaceae bacterium]MBX3033965.1 metallopeptidase family protein [Pseudobdellovibrionaceae bacterium]